MFEILGRSKFQYFQSNWLSEWKANSFLPSSTTANHEIKECSMTLSNGQELLKPLRLGSASDDSNNNLNLIRILLALSVLFSHSYAIVNGDAHTQPFYKTILMTPGTMAVDAFFLISGFLLTGSIEKKTRWN